MSVGYIMLHVSLNTDFTALVNLKEDKDSNKRSHWRCNFWVKTDLTSSFLLWSWQKFLVYDETNKLENLRLSRQVALLTKPSVGLGRFLNSVKRRLCLTGTGPVEPLSDSWQRWAVTVTCDMWHKHITVGKFLQARENLTYKSVERVLLAVEIRKNCILSSWFI